MRRRVGLAAWIAIVLLASSLGAALVVQAASSPGVILNDQATSGDGLIVDAARLPEGGFIVIRNGSPEDPEGLGSILGVSARLSAGYHSDVPVPLERTVDEQRTVTAVLHKDTDDDRVFEAKTQPGTDPPYRQAGAMVTDTATIGPQDRQDGGSETALWIPLSSGGLAAGVALAAWARWYR